MTIQTWLKTATEQLVEAGVASARLDSLLLLEHVLRSTREWVVSHDDTELEAPDSTVLNKMLAQRIDRVPLAYIIGSKEFYGLDFFVNEAVLVPRPESEAIVEMVKQLVTSGSLTRDQSSTANSGSAFNDINTIIDIGTGSGCLAIALKKEFPDVHVTGIDVSEAALRVARKNARRHKAHVQWKQMDLYKHGISKMAKTRPYGIVANLPYVPNGLISSPEITKEPAIALFSGIEGLDHYEELFKQISDLAHKPLFVITESLVTQHSLLAEMTTAAGYYIKQTDELVQYFALKAC
jgi:release factor glutamine methyltransferase